MHTLSWTVRNVKYINYTKRLKSKLYIFYIYLHISTKSKKKGLGNCLGVRVLVHTGRHEFKYLAFMKHAWQS